VAPESLGVAPGVERVVLADADAVARRAAELVADAARRAAAERGRFVIALAGGTTPRIAYERLAELSPMPWAATHVWFGDERCVPPDDPDSNYRMAREALLGRVPIPEAQVTRIEGERAPADAADRYDALLRGDALAHAGAGGAAFDLVLLGVGTDGHTASLFPGGEALGERARWAVAVPAPDAGGAARAARDAHAAGAGRGARGRGAGHRRGEARRGGARRARARAARAGRALRRCASPPRRRAWSAPRSTRPRRAGRRSASPAPRPRWGW
jgi:6-phosphogluconolactonase